MADKQQLIKKGEKLYTDLEPVLEKKHVGEFVAIDVNTGDYFVGKSPIKAINKAQKKHPKKIFFLTQIGRMASLLR